MHALCASGVLHEELGLIGEIAVRLSPLSQVWRQAGSQAYAKHRKWDNMVMSLAAIIPFSARPESPKPAGFAQFPICLCVGCGEHWLLSPAAAITGAVGFLDSSSLSSSSDPCP